jgi:hypothetical protein
MLGLTSQKRWLYRRSIVVDGNFSAEHMRMKNPDQDIWLSNGMGYMVEWDHYKSHLDEAIETYEVCSSQSALQPGLMSYGSEGCMCKS